MISVTPKIVDRFERRITRRLRRYNTLSTCSTFVHDGLPYIKIC